MGPFLLLHVKPSHLSSLLICPNLCSVSFTETMERSHVDDDDNNNTSSFSQILGTASFPSIVFDFHQPAQSACCK
jgi:hypothetical protein